MVHLLDYDAKLKDRLSVNDSSDNNRKKVRLKWLAPLEEVPHFVKMADTEVRSDTRPNLFYQSGFISSVNECLCCIDLNSKLRCALDEISSLSLIIQFILIERKPDCARSSDTDLSTFCENANKKDHNASVCKNWIEVNSKHRSSSILGIQTVY
jgi:hypothetical protein